MVKNMDLSIGHVSLHPRPFIKAAEQNHNLKNQNNIFLKFFFFNNFQFFLIHYFNFHFNFFLVPIFLFIFN